MTAYVRNPNGTTTRFYTAQSALAYAKATGATLQHTSNFGLAVLNALVSGKGKAGSK